MDKRGVSTVIVTVLIILLAVIIVGLVWQFVIRDIIESRIEEAGLLQECIELDLEITKVEYSLGGKEAYVYVKRGVGDAELTGVKILIDGDLKEDSVEIPGELETKKYTITGLEAKPEKIEVAGVITTDRGDQTCGVADSLEARNIIEIV